MNNIREKLDLSSITQQFVVDLSAWEGQSVEFKESYSDSLAREMVAFANSEGGRIYLGVTDQKLVIGLAVTNRLLSQIQDVARHCDPPVPIELITLKHDDHDLLLVRVSEGKKKPYGCSAGYFVRTGPSSQKLNRDELVELAHAMTPVPYERRDCKAFAYPSDFDRKAFQIFLREAKISAKGLSTADLLVNLEFARRENSHLILNNAGVLFFAKNPVRFLPQVRVTCLLYETPARVNILDRKELEYGLMENARQSEVFALQHLSTRLQMGQGLKRTEHREIPVDALREGIVNALVHRDYAVLGANISIEIDPAQVTISNPGGLSPGLSKEAFGKKSFRRNPFIADVLNRVSMVERAGSGIRRIRSALAAANCLPAKFEFTSFFDLIFPRRTVSSPGQVEGASAGQVAGQVSSYAKKVLQFCRMPQGLKTIMVKMGIRKRDNATVHIRSLIHAGLLKLTIPDRPNSRLQKYVTTPAGQNYLKNL